MRNALTAAAQRVSEGQPITDTLGGALTLPTVIRTIIAYGERQGLLDAAMRMCAQWLTGDNARLSDSLRDVLTDGARARHGSR